MTGMQDVIAAIGENDRFAGFFPTLPRPDKILACVDDSHFEFK